MKEKKLSEALSEIVQVDIDVVYSYNRAIKQIEDRVIRNRLMDFRADHENHIAVLSELIRSLGEQPPELSPDFKGYVIEAFAALGSLTGMKGALKALQLTEETANRYYGEAVSREAPSTVKEILRQHFSDEKIHLDYIVSNLEALS